jgi:hypothetical protein
MPVESAFTPSSAYVVARIVRRRQKRSYPGNVAIQGWDEKFAISGAIPAKITLALGCFLRRDGSMATGELYWYQHLGRSDGTASWANGGQHKVVGGGWNFKQVFAADDGVIYGVTTTGDLYWYQHLGRSDGTANWANGGQHKVVGSGWNFKQVFAADDAIVYAVVA